MRIVVGCSSGTPEDHRRALLMGIGAQIWKNTSKSEVNRGIEEMEIAPEGTPKSVPENRDEAAGTSFTEVEARKNDRRRERGRNPDKCRGDEAVVRGGFDEEARYCSFSFKSDLDLEWMVEMIPG